MSLQIGCTVREKATIRPTIGLDDCINVVHVAYMMFVSQKSDSILVFLHILTEELTYIGPLHNNDIIEKIIAEWKSSRIGMSFRWTAWN